MHHHIENESSVFSLLFRVVLSSVVFCCLVLSLLFHLLFSLCLLSLSLCPRLRVMLCCVVLCVWECMWCLWCVWCVRVCGVVLLVVVVRVGVRHAEKPLKKTVCGFRHASVCTFKTSPTGTTRTRLNMCAWCRYTRRRFKRTHALLYPPPTNHTHAKKRQERKKKRNHRQYC